MHSRGKDISSIAISSIHKTHAAWCNENFEAWNTGNTAESKFKVPFPRLMSRERIFMRFKTVKYAIFMR